jgi:hypothetical protein
VRVIRRRLAPLVAIVLTAASGAAPAQDRAASRALAESLFQHGKRLMQEGHPGQACPKFAESQRLEPALGTLLNLAVCHEQDGKTASAWAEFAAAAALAARNGEKERERLAREHLAALEPRLSRLTLAVPHPPVGLELRLDDSLLGEGAWETAVPVDPGPHQISAAAPGHQPWSQSLVVAPGPAVQHVEVVLQDAHGSAPVRASAPLPAVEVTPPVQPAATGSSRRRLASYVAGGIGAVGLGVGGYFGWRAFAEQKTVKRECLQSMCSGDGLAADDRAHRAARLANVGFAVGAVGLGTAAYLFFSEPTRPSAGSARWSLAPLGERGAIVNARGSW